MNESDTCHSNERMWVDAADMPQTSCDHRSRGAVREGSAIVFDAAEGAAKRIGFVAENVAMDAAGPVARTRFTVAPDQAQKLIVGLEEALRHLIAARRSADEINRVGSPGKDVYSGMATISLQQVAGQNEGGYLWANLKAKEALEKTIENVRNALEEYQRTESAATDAFKPKG
ncbi:hypothetical protein JOF41_000254 [Saccharothrix coeruleofusca]|uniref:hypothetical protein n=1 Tax=Saccharothrix coeruleofusca TaxID=33919 RepID=UPI001AE7B140|nr:hypothetical protein [Saccharothrix coeruleofusca]MBP2334076.1 hypothetical protein [Saccharothrix coeruleofusca]